MNVSLTPDLERWVLSRVESGLYTSSSEVMREALRLLREQEELKAVRLEELRRHVRAGLDDADAGRLLPLGEAIAEARRRGHARSAG